MVPSHDLNQCWNSGNSTLRNKLQWSFNKNSNIFIQANALESVVCEMAAILSRPQCVNSLVPTNKVTAKWVLEYTRYENIWKFISYKIWLEHFHNKFLWISALKFIILIWLHMKIPKSLCITIKCFDGTSKLVLFLSYRILFKHHFKSKRNPYEYMKSFQILQNLQFCPFRGNSYARSSRSIVPY